MPSYTSDFSVRQEIGAFPPFRGVPSHEELESLVVRLCSLFEKLSPDAFSSQDQYLALASKLGPVWRRIPEHPTWRRSPATFHGLCDAVRGLISEHWADKAIEDAATGGLHGLLLSDGTPEVFAVTGSGKGKGGSGPGRSDSGKGKGKEATKTLPFAAKVHRPYCGKQGHLVANCWKKYPEKKPAFIPRRPPTNRKPPTTTNQSQSSKPKPNSAPPSSQSVPPTSHEHPHHATSSHVDHDSEERRKRPRNVLPINYFVGNLSSGGGRRSAFWDALERCGTGK